MAHEERMRKTALCRLVGLPSRSLTITMRKSSRRWSQAFHHYACHDKKDYGHNRKCYCFTLRSGEHQCKLHREALQSPGFQLEKRKKDKNPPRLLNPIPLEYF